MSQTIFITSGTVEPLEGPQYCFEGDQPVFSVTKQGVTTITDDSTLTMHVYKGSSDKTADFTSGNMSASGNVATSKTFVSLIGGDNLFVTMRGTCDGLLLTFVAFELRVRKLSGR